MSATIIKTKLLGLGLLASGFTLLGLGVEEPGMLILLGLGLLVVGLALFLAPRPTGEDHA